MLSKAAPKTNKPAHKALQGWLRTDQRERETERHRQTEMIIGRCEMTRGLEILETEIHVEKFPD